MPVTFSARGPIALPSVSATATWNPSDAGLGTTLSNGNLTIVSGSGSFAYTATRATRSASIGKYYSEHTIDEDNAFSTFMGIGIISASRLLTDPVGPAGTPYGLGYEGDGGYYDYTQSPALATYQAWVKTNTVCMAIDLDNRKVWFRVCNGATVGNWNNSGTDNPATNTGGGTINAAMSGVVFFPAINHLLYTATAQSTTSNFGGSAYAYKDSSSSGFGNW